MLTPPSPKGGDAPPFSLYTYVCIIHKSEGEEHPHVPHGMSAALLADVCTYLPLYTMELRKM